MMEEVEVNRKSEESEEQLLNEVDMASEHVGRGEKEGGDIFLDQTEMVFDKPVMDEVANDALLSPNLPASINMVGTVDATPTLNESVAYPVTREEGPRNKTPILVEDDLQNKERLRNTTPTRGATPTVGGSTDTNLEAQKDATPVVDGDIIDTNRTAHMDAMPTVHGDTTEANCTLGEAQDGSTTEANCTLGDGSTTEAKHTLGEAQDGNSTEAIRTLEGTQKDATPAMDVDTTEANFTLGEAQDGNTNRTLEDATPAMDVDTTDANFTLGEAQKDSTRTMDEDTTDVNHALGKAQKDATPAVDGDTIDANRTLGETQQDAMPTVDDKGGVTGEDHSNAMHGDTNGGPTLEGMGEECSRSATPTVGEVLTDSMVKEERRLKEGGSREGSEDGDQRGELKGMVEQQRFQRLQHLLKQSNVYSKFLLQRMEEQRQKQEKKDQQRREKAQRRKSVRKKKGQTPQVSPDSGRVTRLSLKSPSSTTQTPAVVKGKGGAKRGRKRKATEGEENFQISDFMDNKGKLKQMRLNSGKEAVTVTEKNMASLSTHEFELEERYFDGKVIPYNQPRLVTGGIMRSYQLEGMEWVKSLYENGVNGILGDEMGLGKTLQCIAVIAYLIEQGVKGPFLVAAPLSTVPNWVAEFKRFTPKIPVVLYHGTATEREDLRRQIFSSTRPSRYRSAKKAPSPDKDEPLLPVVVTSYEICMRDQRYLEQRSWKFLVVDEGHRIKNLNCKLIRALKQYDAGNRLLLTGTPLQNNLSELWSLLNFLLPNIFNDLDSFQSWFDFDVAGEDEVRERIIAQEREQHVLSTLHQILTPFLLRRLKTDVEFSLPPKKEVLVYAPLTSYQESYYKSLLDNTIYQMLEDSRRKKEKLSPKKADSLGKRDRKMVSKYNSLNDDDFEAILKGEKELEDLCPTQPVEQKKKVSHSVLNIKMTSVYMMLRKCCNHPYLLEFPLTENGEFKVDEQIVNSCGKIMLLDRMLPALIQEGHKTLIFSQFTSMLDILEDYLELRGVVFSRLDGSMAFSEREKQMTMFRESPDCMIFLLSTRAGGLGINLTSADTVIIYDSDWNPQADLQAQDRCHRIGQTHPVMVYRLVTANTIDQRIVERAATKRRLEKMVIHKGKFKGVSSDSELSIDDLVDLLHSVDHEKIVDSEDAVISDEALAALLNRSLQNDKTKEKEEDDLKNAHLGIFKVIAERDSSGNLIGAEEADGPSTSNGLDAGSGTGSMGGAEVVTRDGQDTDSGAGSMGATEMTDLSTSSSPASTTPEPASSSSLKSSSSASISSSSCSACENMDIDADTPASSAVLTGSYSPTPEPNAGGVVVTDTEVKVCTGELEVEDNRTVSSESVMTS